MIRLYFPIITKFSTDYEEQILIINVKSEKYYSICQVPPAERGNLREK